MLTIPFPRAGVWTREAYHALPEDLPVDFELVDGSLVVNAKPSIMHNQIAFRLASILDSSPPPEWQIGLDADVLLSDDADEPTEVAPDLVVCSATHNPKTRPIPVALVSLAIEIVSPSSTRKDRRFYPLRYAEAGIPHYWRIETPITSDALRIHTFRLQEGEYIPTGEFTDVLDVSEPFPIAFEVGSLLD